MPVSRILSPPNGSKRSRSTASNPRRRVSNPQRSLRNPSIVSTGVGFPARMKMVHKYCDSVAITISAGGGLGYRYRFSCNGMYDPDKTSTGHQPMYFDQMTDLYNHYTVTGSKIDVTFVSANSCTVPVDVAICLDDDQTTPLSLMSEAREQKNAVYGFLPPGEDTPITLTKYWSAAKVFGGNPLSRKELSGDATANPLETTEYNLWVGTPASGPQTIYAQVTVTYFAVWDEIKEKTSS